VQAARPMRPLTLAQLTAAAALHQLPSSLCAEGARACVAPPAHRPPALQGCAHHGTGHVHACMCACMHACALQGSQPVGRGTHHLAALGAGVQVGQRLLDRRVLRLFAHEQLPELALAASGGCARGGVEQGERGLMMRQAAPGTHFHMSTTTPSWPPTRASCAVGGGGRGQGA